MDNWQEVIVPIIVFVIWLAGQLLGKQKSQDTDDEPAPFTPLNHPANDEAERTRRIQEEIRRKIAERRGEQPPPPPGQPAPPPIQREETPQHRQPPPLKPRRPETMPSPPFVARGDSGFPPPITSSTEPQFIEVPPPTRNYEAELEAMQQRMEESQRRAEEARRRTQQRLENAFGGQSAAPRKHAYTGGNVARRVRERLREPDAAREAFVYLEILGTPVGQRERGAMRPSWES